MFLNPVTVIAKILATPIASKILHRANRSEIVINILKELGLDPTHPPEDFDGIYAYALVEYGIDNNGRKKHKEVLELFRQKEIREAFKNAFYSGNKSTFNEAVERAINLEDIDGWDTLGASIKRQNINILEEVEEFRKAFNQQVEKSQTPAHKKASKILDELSNKIDISHQSTESSKLPLNITGFEPLIKEKTKLFCGRKFVFEQFEDFIANNSNGYFVVVGDAGMGKSAIAAKYVSDHQAICFFNILSEGRNTPDKFLKTIRQQLINRYQLENVQEASLSTLLTKAAERISTEEPLVIVVDALDEVEQKLGAENILYLPEALPEKVYFLLTRRPYTPDKKRLRVSVPVEELDLTTNEYQIKNREDIKEYIDFFIQNDIEHKNALKKWIKDRNITANDFIEQVAEKSENNFMYVRYILPAIARGFYDDLSLQQLPDGLQEYYQTHWVRMGMDNKPQELMVKILFILVEIGTPITLEMIAEISQQDEYHVQSILDKWVEYLKKQEMTQEVCYSIYHASFLDFLKAKRVLDSKRKIFEEVNQSISDYL